jgi:hypothetical protein
MLKDYDFEVLAPGIHIYSNVGFLDHYNKIIDYAKDEKLDWVARRPQHNLDDIMFYPEDEGYIKEIYDDLDKSFRDIEQSYLQHFHTPTKKAEFSKREFFYILRYKDSDWGAHHFDDYLQDTIRRVSTAYYPNDDYDGGELYFPRLDVTIKPKADQLVIFPSSYAYDHKILPITSGTRYIIGSCLS